jgi:hypothetical protein
MSPAGQPPILVLHARALAFAGRFALGELDNLEAALVPLRAYAAGAGLIEKLGANVVDQIIIGAFVSVLGGGIGHA